MKYLKLADLKFVDMLINSGEITQSRAVEILNETIQTKIENIISAVANEHPYKVVGVRDTYSQYNEGWEDACGNLLDKIESDRLI